MVTRAEFLVQLTSSGWVLFLAGCGGGGGYDAGPAPPAQAAACSATQITNNHGHTLTMPTADLNSTVSMSYNIQGSANHSHLVTFSAAQLAQLKAGQSVTVATTVSLAHQHDLSAACA